MHPTPDPDEFFEHYLYYADPDRPGKRPRGPAEQWQAWWRDRWRECGADPCGTLAREQGFVLTSVQADERGCTRGAARSRVHTGSWMAPARGVLSPLAVTRLGSGPIAARRAHALASAAAARSRPTTVVSSHSAAVLHGLPTLAVPDLPLLIGLPTDTFGRRARAHVLRSALLDSERTDWFGVPVTTVARTVVDVARADRRDGLMAADAALYSGLVTEAELTEAVLRSRGWPGTQQAREIIGLASPLAESPLESLVRLALHDDGFPPPKLQTVIVDQERGQTYRVDLCWPEHRLILEADGRVKYRSDAVESAGGVRREDDPLWREKRRETRLRRLGYRVERVLWDDVMRDWPATRARLARELGVVLPARVVALRHV